MNSDPIEIEIGHSGLTASEVTARRKQYGENALPAGKPPSPLTMLLSQFKSPLIYVILGAALVSLFLKEYQDFWIIMGVVVFDVILGFIQEYQAAATYQSLKSLVKPMAIVIRDGHRVEVDSKELVPGDVVLLAAGDKPQADGLLLEAKNLSLNESILTGESEAVIKREGDSVFMGTTTVAGRGVFQVTAIGRATKLGEIAQSITDTPDAETPLQKRLAAFSVTLTKFVVAVTAGMYVIGVAMGKNPIDMVRTAIILAIAAIPEGLLIAVTVILVLGMKRILTRQGLVKRLLAVETLGSVTVICTDKTGTLTEGLMRVVDWDFADEDMALKVLALNNNLADSMEVALWDLARSESGIDPAETARQYPRADELPFSSEAKFMITANEIGDSRYLLLKGAPEVVLGKCGVDDEARAALLTRFDDWARKGQRLLGLAYRQVDGDAKFGAAVGSGEVSGAGSGRSLDEGQSEGLDDLRGFVWAGLVGLQDPVREEVPASIETCKRAGIQVKMITGDHRLTAIRVARSIGLDADESGVIEGKDLETMSDEELLARIKDVSVFARVLPHQKLRIVSALQSLGEVVAMVGDGVNDAPALKKSDIGVVVGTATDVAKETADLVLMDSDFKTTVAAVEEGRVVFQNIKKVVSYTLSNSFAEILLVFVSMLLGWPAPLTVAQILWIHLICDGPVDIVLGFEPKEEGIMEEDPRPVSEPILDRLGMGLIGAISVTAAAGCLWMFGHHWMSHGDLALARTIAFETLAVISLVYVFAYRSMRRSLFHSGHLTSNKPLLAAVGLGFVLAFLPSVSPTIGKALGVVPLQLEHWAMVFGLSFSLLFIVEVAKHVALGRAVRKADEGAME